MKCSGDQPCVNCRNAGDGTDCVYPSRDRQIKLSEQYVEELLKENERLRNNNVATVLPTRESAIGTVESDENVRNPLLEDRPWFHAVSSEQVPLFVGEAADSAFATRFRQTLATGNTRHFPRMSYVRDEVLMTLVENTLQWPSPARARFLVKVALSTICQYYHIVRRSTIMKDLEEAIQNNGAGDRSKICRLLMLFALGEMYSAKFAAQESTFPGLAYFAHARIHISITAERPQLETIEISLLLVCDFPSCASHS